MIIFYRRRYSKDGDSRNIPILDWANCEIDMYCTRRPDASLVMEKPEWESFKASHRIAQHSRCADDQ